MEKEKFAVGDPILQGYLDVGPERLSQAVSNFLNPKAHTSTFLRYSSGSHHLFLVLPMQRPTFLYYPDLKTVPIYKSETFPWVEV